MSSFSSTIAGRLTGDRRFLLILGLLSLVAFPGVWFGAEAFVFRDFGFYSYPAAAYWRDSFWRGELPLWNPYNNCGIPFLAQWSTLVLYPPSLIYVLLPLPWSIGLFLMLHQLFAGWGMYRLARAWSGSELGATLAGTGFAFGGILLNCLIWPHWVASLAWMPWVILLVEKAWRTGGRDMVVAALAAAMQMLSGVPEVIVLTWLTLLGLCLGKSWMAKRRGQGLRMSSWLRFTMIVVVVSLLAAAQILPFIDLLMQSNRDSGFSKSTWAMPIWGWANLLVPTFRTYPSQQGPFFQIGQLWTTSYYAGIALLALALTGIFQRGPGRSRIWGLGLGLLFTAWLGLGDEAGLYRWLRTLIPQLGMMRYPVKFMILPSMLIPLLAAYGVARLERDGKSAVRAWVASVAGLAVMALAICAYAKLHPASGEATSMVLLNGVSRIALLAVAGIAVWMGMKMKSGPDWRIGGVLLVVVWIDLMTHVPWQNPTVPPKLFLPGAYQESKLTVPPLGDGRVMVSSFANHAFYERVSPDVAQTFFVVRQGLSSNIGLIDRIPAVDGFYSLYLRHARRVVSMMYVDTEKQFPGIMDFMGVRTVTAPGEYIQWQSRTSAMPMITAGQRVELRDDEAALRDVLEPGFNGRERVLLASDSTFPLLPVTSARVENVRWETHSVRFDVKAGGDTLAVISQAFDHNWRAKVDGRDVPLLRANLAFQAVAVSAGDHSVELRYVNRAFQTGVALSLLGLAGCGVFWIRIGKRGGMTS